MAMVRRTHWFDPDQLDQVAIASRRRSVSQSQYLRDALNFQLGRDSARDEVAALEAIVEDLRAELTDTRQRVAMLARHR